MAVTPLVRASRSFTPALSLIVCRYQLVPGVCSKSYGLNVANMAGLYRSIVKCAERKASELAVATAAARTPQASALRRLCALLDAHGAEAPTAEDTRTVLSLLPQLQ